MLKNFDILCENLLVEGRKSDENKKFCLDLDVCKQIVDELESEHEDKGHFKSIISHLKEKPYYTPRSFREEISRIFRKLKKHEIADGYAKIFYKFLVDHENCPCSPYKEEEKLELDDENVEDKDLEMAGQHSARSELDMGEPQTSEPDFFQGKQEEEYPS